MARTPKPKAYDWKNRKFPEDWNATTFRAYLSEKHFERFGIKYVAKNISAEAGMIKRMIDEYGADVVKEFIDRSLRLYKPTPRYPGINFATMLMFYKAQVIPQILAEKAKEEKRKQISEVEVVAVDNLSDWF